MESLVSGEKNNYMSVKAMESNTLDDIKEEEDIELKQLNSDLSSNSNPTTLTTTSSSGSNESIVSNLNEGLDTENQSLENLAYVHNTTAISGNLVDNNNVQSERSNSKDELNLLPPLPDNHEEDMLNKSNLILSDDNNTIPSIAAKDGEFGFNNDIASGLGLGLVNLNQNMNSSRPLDENHFLNSISDTDSNDLLDPNTIAETSFDLSKALKIPENVNLQQQFGAHFNSNSVQANNDTNTDLNTPMNSNIYDSNNNSTTLNTSTTSPLSPIITSPRLLLKKKFSNVMLNSSSHISSNDETQSFQPEYFPIPTLAREIPNSPSSSNSSSDNNLGSTVMNKVRNTSRKISIGSNHSSSTVNSANKHLKKLNNDDLLYKIPMRASGNLQESVYRTRSDSTSSSIRHKLMESNNRESSVIEKRPPLLKRASSALLKKTSIINLSSYNKNQTSNSITPEGNYSPSLSITSSFDQHNNEQPFDSMQYVTQINFNSNSNTDLKSIATSTYFDGSDEISRNPSIGSRVKKSFSRIISNSGDSVKRVVSNPSLRNETPTPGYIKTSGAFELSSNGTPVYERTSAASTRSSSVKNLSSISPVYRRKNNSISSHTNNVLGTDSSATRSGLNFSDSRSSSNKSGISRNTQLSTTINKQNKKEENVVTGKLDINSLKVNVDKLTKSIPVISVTDNYNPKQPQNYMIQSNISFDEAYYGNEPSISDYDTQNTHITLDKENLSQEHKNMTIKEYISLLIKQQEVEDKRLEKLEDSFKSSGWCSPNDLDLLRTKRNIINKKWADRILYYQNHVDT